MRAWAYAWAAEALQDAHLMPIPNPTTIDQPARAGDGGTGLCVGCWRGQAPAAQRQRQPRRSLLVVDGAFPCVLWTTTTTTTTPRPDGLTHATQHTLTHHTTGGRLGMQRLHLPQPRNRQHVRSVRFAAGFVDGALGSATMVSLGGVCVCGRKGECFAYVGGSNHSNSVRAAWCLLWCVSCRQAGAVWVYSISGLALIRRSS